MPASGRRVLPKVPGEERALPGRKKYRAPLIGFFRFLGSSRHSFAPQMIDFVDNFYLVVASKCSSRSNVVLLKSASSRQVAGRSSPFIAHIGAGHRSWSCRPPEANTGPACRPHARQRDTITSRRGFLQQRRQCNCGRISQWHALASMPGRGSPNLETMMCAIRPCDSPGPAQSASLFSPS
jgi:hypothetical protein